MPPKGTGTSDDDAMRMGQVDTLSSKFLDDFIH